MLYESTRGRGSSVTSAEAIKQGISPDGGLFVPDRDIHISMDEIASLKDMSYVERAIKILGLFLTDFSDSEIRECVEGAYGTGKFDTPDIVPLYKLSNHAFIQELWHGPTCAFKDVALQILPRLLVKSLRKTGETGEVVILVATSGDTGKAALEGFRDVPGTKIIVFFPDGGVSQMQKMQMVTQEGTNVYSVAVRGNFDDTQSGVKAIFTDNSLINKLKEKNIRFSSANSINWGRLVPQIVYYFSAYADLLKKGEIQPGDKVNFVVPTGNFGNILAAYYAYRMGLPVNRLICASNENNVLTDFIHTGVYDRNRPFKRTISPSMDILISSNLERLLYHMTDGNASKVKEWMSQLNEAGYYEVDDNVKKKVKDLFWSDFSTEEEILTTIGDVYRDFGYLVDTHTAVAIDVYDKYIANTDDLTATVIASTASPFKFNESVAKAIASPAEYAGKDEFELLRFLSEKTGLKVPEGLRGLNEKPVLHNRVCEKKDMKKVVEEILA